ncbi:hypothetical protein [Corynebacterium ulcerans]|uniref:hypothetical protein n=1 Tax=Corynebacterium ulcerans TaxID=65058 RepID=UPI000C76C2F2|nr:hypothetical protein [Corynebacterium ulcerans]PLW02587.1 hypothetical protein BRL54_06065 [Corynebacterium ulcerans]
MGSTIHFFIPVGGIVPVPDRFSSTRNPSDIQAVNTDSPYLTEDGIHFIFHHIELDAPTHLGLEACMLAASSRAGNLPNRGPRPEEISKNYQTVVEVMVEFGDPTPLDQDIESIQRGSSPETLAFDRAVDELNVLLRAIAFVQRFPIKSISRESVSPMIPFAFSTRKPWEMTGNDELPELALGGMVNLNFNYSLTPDMLGDFEDLDKWINTALVNLSAAGPFTTYLDFRREADINRSKDGNYRAATIMYAAACESLLEELLQHNLWEQNLRPEEAREKFVTRNGYPKAISYLVNNELGNFYTSTG